MPGRDGGSAEMTFDFGALSDYQFAAFVGGSRGAGDRRE